MYPQILLLFFYMPFVFAIINIRIDSPSTCRSLIDCFDSSDSQTTICYEGYCAPCRQSGELCSSSSHCCSGARCYRHHCTILYETGHICRLNRQCYDLNDFCINNRCTRCQSLWSPCSLRLNSSPCCTGISVCRNNICQPARRNLQYCRDTFDCADDLICLSGKCQNPLGQCGNEK